MNNIGTLIISAIRPQSDLDTFPTAYANELLGGHHSYDTYSDLTSMPSERISEGMFAFVLDTETTYFRKDGNWEILQTGASNSSGGGLFVGSVDCNTLDQIYIVNHQSISDNHPLVSLQAPTSGDNLYTFAITDVTDVNFKVVLSGIPAVSGYKINWIIPVADLSAIDLTYLENLIESNTNYIESVQSQLEDLTGQPNVTHVNGLTGNITLQSGTNVNVYQVDSTTIGISASGSDQGFTPLEGTGVQITPVGQDYEFGVVDYVSKSEVSDVSGYLQDQIDNIASPDVSVYATKVEVDEISGGFDSRITTLEGNPVPDILRSEVSDISGYLQDQINSIEEEQTIVLGGTGITVTESPTHTWTIDVTGDYLVDSDLDDYITTSEVNDISGFLEDQIDEINLDINNLDSSLTTLIVSVSGNLQSQIDAIVVPNVDIYSTKVEVSEISGGFDSRLTTLEGNLVADIFRTEVSDISGYLQDQINSIEEEQTVVLGGNGVSVTESPTHTWTVEVTGDYLIPEDLDDYITTAAVNSLSGNLQDQIDDLNQDLVNLDSTLTTMIVNVSGQLQDQIDGIVIPDVSVYATKVEVDEISGGFDSRLTSLEGIDHVNTLNGLLGNITLQSGNNIDVYEVDSTTIGISSSSQNGFTPLEGTGIEITSVGDDYEFSVVDYVSKSEVNDISGYLQDQIDGIIIPDVSVYATKVEVDEISGGFDSRLNSLEGDDHVNTINGLLGNITLQAGASIGIYPINSTTIGISSAGESGGGITEHNLLNQIQGGSVGEYYHLTESQYNDYIGKTEVSDISGYLQDQINSIEEEQTIVLGGNGVSVTESPTHTWTVEVTGQYLVTSDLDEYITTAAVNSLSGNLQDQIDGIVIPDVSVYATKVEVDEISGGFDSRITTLEGNLVPDIFRTEVSSISGYLQDQINSIEEEQTIVLGGNGVSVTESPTHTWTVEVTGQYLVTSDLDDYITTSEVNDISGYLQDQIITVQSDMYNLDVMLTTLILDVSGNLQDQIDAIVIPDVSVYATKVEVNEISGGLNNRITDLENEPKPDIFRTEVSSISGYLQDQINGIESEQTVVLGGNGVSVTESPTHTWTVEVTGSYLVQSDLDDYITSTEVSDISGYLQDQIDSIVIPDVSIYATKVEVDEISGGFDSRLTTLEGDNYVNTLNGLLGNVTLQAGASIGIYPINSTTIGISSAGESGGGITEHNLLNQIQGGSVGEYYHLTESQYNDYIGKTEVSDISGYLQDQIDGIVIPDVSVYATKVEVDEISGGFDSRLTTLEGDNYVNTLNGLLGNVTLQAGTNIDVYEVNSTTIGISSAPIDGDVSSFSGLVNCNTTDIVYTITHPSISDSKPVVSVSVPTSADTIFAMSITDISLTEFKVVLSGIPAVPGYKINWIIPVADISTVDLTYLEDLIENNTNYIESVQTQLEDLSGQPKVTYVNGLTGNITLQAGQNIDVYEIDSTTIGISSSSQNGFTPLEGTGINIVPVGDDYEFNVVDYVSKTEVNDISGYLQDQIDSIVIPDVSVYATKVEVDEISGGFDSRLTTLEGNPISDIFRSEVSDISGYLQDQINSIEEEQTIVLGGNGVSVTESPTHTWTVEVTGQYLVTSDLDDYITTSEVNDISGYLQDQINGIVIPDVSVYATKVEVDEISGGFDSRLTTLEGNLVPDIFRSEVSDISGYLQDQINSIEEEQTIVLGGNGVSVTESPTHTWTINVTGEYLIPEDLDDYITTSEVNDISGYLQDQIDGIVIPDVSIYATKVEVDEISGGFDSRLTTLEGDNYVNTLNGLLGNVTLQAGTNIDVYEVNSTTIGISASSIGQGFTPLEGTGINIVPVGDDYEFNVVDYVSKTEVNDISGYLQDQIDIIDGELITGDGQNSYVTYWTGIDSISGDESFQYNNGTVLISTVDVNGGEIDGTTIGANSASTGSFTSLTTTGQIIANVNLDSNREITIRNTNTGSNAFAQMAVQNDGTRRAYLGVTSTTNSALGGANTGYIGSNGTLYILAGDAVKASVSTTEFSLSSGMALVVQSTTPANSGSTGTSGTVTWDSNHIYVCTAANTWKQTPLNLVGSGLDNYIIKSEVSSISAGFNSRLNTLETEDYVNTINGLTSNITLQAGSSIGIYPINSTTIGISGSGGGITSDYSGNSLYNFKADVLEISGNILLNANTHMAKVINTTGPTTFTVPNDLPKGFSVTIAQFDPGVVNISAGSGAIIRDRLNRNKLGGLYAVGTIITVRNPNGTSSVSVLGGDLTA